MTGESEERGVFALEAPYQLAMVAAILLGLAVLAFFPTAVGRPPGVYEAAVGLRAATLVALGVLVRGFGPRQAWPALLAWSAMMLAPELWAHAAEASAANPLLPALGSSAYGLAGHSLARLSARAWPLVLAALAAVVLLLPAPYSPYHQLLGAGVPFWVLVAVVAAGLGALREARP